jgi:hypothetical protein
LCKELGERMLYLNFINVIELLKSVKDYSLKGEKVELDDKPLKRAFGYKVNNEVHWEISLVNLKKSCFDLDRPDIMKLFTTPEGRMKALSLDL